MKVAVVDIGSNGIRCTFYKVEEVDSHEVLLKKISYLRLPIRLGADVFTEGRISLRNMSRVMSLAHAFRHLCMIHEVDACRLVATSAMREAENGNELIELIRSQTQVEIELVPGEIEAELILESIYLSDLIDYQSPYIGIDVGGGSTEVNFLINGERKSSRSFRLGSVRCKDGFDPDEWNSFRDWISVEAKQYQPMAAIGTGGNINRMHKLCRCRPGQSLKQAKFADKLAELEGMTQKELLEKVKLKTDRADVIVPASKIYFEAMLNAEVSKIIVPKIGLAEGVARDLFRRLSTSSAV